MSIVFVNQSLSVVFARDILIIGVVFFPAGTTGSDYESEMPIIA